MNKHQKYLIKILSGLSDKNIEFKSLVNLLLKLNFKLRIKGSHHIFINEKVEEILNIQPKNGKAKPYQVKQVRNVLLKYKLRLQ